MRKRNKTKEGENGENKSGQANIFQRVHFRVLPRREQHGLQQSFQEARRKESKGEHGAALSHAISACQCVQRFCSGKCLEAAFGNCSRAMGASDTWRMLAGAGEEMEKGSAER